jgi:DNA-directed RNA polymerase specialized sigma24 family protein
VTVEAGSSNHALDELRALYPPLRRYAAVVGSCDVEPDDLVQEAFTRFLSQPPGRSSTRRPTYGERSSTWR